MALDPLRDGVTPWREIQFPCLDCSKNWRWSQCEPFESNFFTHSHSSSSFPSHPFLAGKRCMQCRVIQLSKIGTKTGRSQIWQKSFWAKCDRNPWSQQSQTNRAAPPLFASLQFWLEKVEIRRRKAEIEQFNGVAKDWWRQGHLASLLICSSPKDGSSLLPRAGFNWI